MTSMTRLGNLIDAFRPADGPPPQSLWPFMRWSLKGSWPMLWLSGIISAIAGASEVVSALILGWVIDAAVNSGPQAFFANHLALLLGFVVFYIILRPLAFGISAASNGIIVGPNVLSI